MTQTSNPDDTTERSEHHQNDSGDSTDPVYNRPMSIEEIQTAYAKYADRIDRMEWFDQLLTGRYRRKQFEKVEGHVLDVACGTGTNFRHLPETIELVGIDISSEMLAKARERCDQLGLDGELHRMDAQALDFPDDSFDVVISTLSTCTFPDPVAALQEMERVCKPTGQILLVEHGRSSVDLIARFQEWRADAHYSKMGCRLTQDPLKLVSKAGLPIRKTESEMFGIITTIEAQPN